MFPYRYGMLSKGLEKTKFVVVRLFHARPVRCWRLYLFPFVVKGDFNEDISFCTFSYSFFPINEVLLLFNCPLWIFFYRTFLSVESEGRQMNFEVKWWITYPYIVIVHKNSPCLIAISKMVVWYNAVRYIFFVLKIYQYKVPVPVFRKTPFRLRLEFFSRFSTFKLIFFHLSSSCSWWSSWLRRSVRESCSTSRREHWNPS